MKAVAVCLVALLAGCHGATLSTTSMVNTSALIGGSVSFICTVSGDQLIGETLSINKIHSGGSFLISQDSSVANGTKHSVAGKYTVTINSIDFSDEGEYRCTLGTTAATTAYLTVGVKPTNAWLYFTGNQTTAVSGVKTNLTCEADRAYPPATMRWFKGSTDVSSTAITPSVTVDSNGYGNGISHIELTPTDADLGVVYTCHVDVPGASSTLTRNITMAFSGSSTIMASFGILVAALFATKF